MRIRTGASALLGFGFYCVLVAITSASAAETPPTQEAGNKSADPAASIRSAANASEAEAFRPFRPVARPPVPDAGAAWARNAIDSFVADRHVEEGLRPAAEAPRHVLLRRVYLDLVGLPPTRSELEEFLGDDSPSAYEKVVDRLLSSPLYGERWGRHWMDVWRYSDWAGWGEQVRDSQPHIWRWRDWIVDSLNGDVGYDRMVIDMLAADEIAPGDDQRLRATGFLVRNYKLLSREQWMQDTVNHTTKAFLGVTLECARCHDHKYDAISQEEYYRVRAIFEPYEVRIDRLPGEPDTAKLGLARVYDAKPDVKTFLFERGDDRKPVEDHPLEPGVPAILGGSTLGVEPVSLPLTAAVPDKREFVIEETIAASQQALIGARESRARILESAESSTDKRRLADLDIALAEANLAALEATIRVERIEDEGDRESETWRDAATGALDLQRKRAVAEAERNALAAKIDADSRQGAESTPADAASPSPAEKAYEAAKEALEKARAALELPPSTEYERRKLTTYPQTSTGRRLAFARWIASEDNPLTARVAVNHIWGRHFGKPLVESVFDFGRNGKPPSHPALLDWLAAELMAPAEAGAAPWSLKHIHRLIVTSSTYRMDSRSDTEANEVRDPENRFLWHWASRRVEAEVVRDIILYVTGGLDLARGGPEIDQERGFDVPRRSLYFRHAQEKQMTFLKTFDAAAVTECYRRKESVVPQQALALANSELVWKRARALARELTRDSGRGEKDDASSFVSAAFEVILTRSPDPQELAECLEFLETQTRFLRKERDRIASGTADEHDFSKGASAPALRARENLVHVLLNHHDFVTLR